MGPGELPAAGRSCSLKPFWCITHFHTLSNLAHHSSTTFSQKLFGPFPKMLKIKKNCTRNDFSRDLEIGPFFSFFFLCFQFAGGVN